MVVATTAGLLIKHIHLNSIVISLDIQIWINIYNGFS